MNKTKIIFSIGIILTAFILAFGTVKTFSYKDTETYDTLYVVSKYRYYLIDDSTIRKRVVNDTIHTLDDVPEFPISTVKILRVDTIK